jgi:hypothetical protein
MESPMSEPAPAPPERDRNTARISFDRLRERTDELELLISGLCLFGLLAVPGWLVDLYAENYVRLPVLLLAATATAVPILTAIATALAACLILHLVVRAYWVGLIGLRAAFAGGIDWNSPSIGPVQRERLSRRLPDLDTAIARADRWASMVFAVFVLAALVLACMGFWSTLIFVGGAWLGGAEGGTNRWINVGIETFITVVVFAPILLWLLDGVLARRWASLAGRTWFRLAVGLLARIVGVVFPERLIGPIRLTLQSHFPRVVFIPLLALLVLGVPWLGLSVFRNVIGFDKFGTQTHVQAEDLWHGLRNANYESLRTRDDRLRINAMIPAPVHEGDWLPLFLPYVAMRDDPVLAHRCPPRADRPVPGAGQIGSKDSDADAEVREQADREQARATATCLARLWKVRLNGVPVSLDAFMPAERADLGARGLAGFIDMRGQQPGPQQLEVIWRPRPQDDPPLDDYVPQRLITVIPFAWSPAR